MNRASFYDPGINRSFGMMASHYGVGVLPARPKRPKDKAKVESGVRFAQSCILGRLRNQTFFSLDEANAAIREAVERINTHVMRRLDQCRRDLFETMERPALAALPAEEYEFAEWRLARVSTDYHVEFERYFYSVPHSLIRQQVDVRATSRTIEIFFKGKRVAAHQRRYGGARFGTEPDHMPSSHRRYAEWSPERSGAGLVRSVHRPRGSFIAILASRPHPEQGFRTCLGVLKLYQAIDTAQAEAVSGPCARDRRPELQKHQRPHQIPQSLQAHRRTCRRRRAR
ncbi:Mu transposase domain-containing protein [Mesorhizobium sp. ORM16]|uniref:Mu transposase domain-containing protein n=1 Tax=Mesorhizobium sp. ORM16 TaxID=3376989 RepID=UPI003857427C